MNSNAKSYKVIFYKKVKFNLPSTEYNTKGETITFGTPSLTGVAFPDAKGDIWEEWNYTGVSAASDAVSKLGSLLNWSNS